MATYRQVMSEKSFQVFKTNTTLPSQRTDSELPQVPATDDTTSNSSFSTLSKESVFSSSKTNSTTLVKSIKRDSKDTINTIDDLDDLDFPTTLPPPPPAAELRKESSSNTSVESGYKTKIRTIEELLDSSSDLDFPISPPPPPTLSSAPVSPTPSSTLPPPTTMSANKKVFLNKNGASNEFCASKLSNDCGASFRAASSTNLNSDRPNSISPTPTTVTTIAALGGISANHYERLIEELKCPGCASPMKAPIKLCATGHSICQNCTTVLLLCPLCKAPFIDLRSLTLEALCSKAHFRCCNAAAGCTVRLQIDLLNWHEKQCVWKSMKCFMGRVWGNCSWTGREAGWKDHLESAHADRVFTTSEVDLVWNMNGKVKSLAGYYVFEVYDEMFNFYQVYDKDRILFTMTVTSTVRDRKFNFAYEVEMFHQDNEALVITQRFPVHSEYDKDILLDGTCVCVMLTDLTRFFDQDKNLHFRVRIYEVKSPKKSRAPKKPSRKHPIDFQQTDIEGANLKSVPAGVIVTRKLDDIPLDHTNDIDEERDFMKDEDTSSSDDPEFEAFIEKNWGTPQMNFNRKYLRSGTSKDSSTSSGSSNLSAITDSMIGSLERQSCEASGTKSKMKNVTSSLRKSFRSLRTDIIDLKKPFIKKSPEKKESLIKK